MKRITDFFFSMFSTVLLLLIFATSIGYATFAENATGTEYAHEIIYNARWFEVLLVFLTINLIGSVIRYKIVNKRKFSVLLFHLSFILILFGAGITRYVGSEGIMHIRQGETSNEISSNKTSVSITAEYKGQKVDKSVDASFSENGSTNLSEKIEIGGKSITVENELFVPNSVETLVPDDQGEPALSLFVMNAQNQGLDFILSKGESNQYEGITFGFGGANQKSEINFSSKDNQLYFTSTLSFAKMSMMAKNEDMIMPGTLVLVEQKTIYKTEKLLFVLKNYFPKAKRNLTQLTPEMNKSGIMVQGKNAIIFNVSDGNVSQKLHVLSSENQVSPAATCKINDVKVSISYGIQPQKLPFSITLREFQLERYPGSNSPSSYASEITVTDTEMKTVKPFRIYMNNILNYRGYRFFQSSYDQDEKGTVLSVNHDYWGTLVTYLGYFFMLIGMILTLFNKNSRFFTVIKLSDNLQKKRKAAKTLLMVALLATTGTLFAGNNADKKSHFDALSSLLIQDEVQGRVEPISTYASDLLRKISKKTTYKDQSSLEVLLGMCTNAEHWQNEPVIKVAHAGLAKELCAVKDYVSFNQLIDFENGGAYKLAEKVNAIYQKDPSARNQYEKELVNVDERVNILNGIFSGTILTIFPVVGEENAKWIAVTDLHATPTKSGVCPVHSMDGMSEMSATMGESMGNSKSDKCPVSGKSGKAEKLEDSQTGMPAKMNDVSPMDGNMTHSGQENSQVASPFNFLKTYFEAVLQATESGNWAFANTALSALKSYQQLNGGIQLPTKTNVKFEVMYNNLSIFLTLAILYGLIGFILLGFHIINILKYNPKIDKWLEWSIYPLILMFILYSAGLALRWYISGHAPWSNGYESMIFIGWAAAFSGVVFAGRSPITLAITSLLAAIAMSVAGMSWMNPEITNLVPVLKSYWLVVHVAVITSSYGFFAMAALLGLFNLCLMIIRNQKNATRLNESIQEFSYIIELSLTIGLFMLTVGTFLGGIWANESWGRYWGWDSKETWALVSVLVYSIVLHLRNVPKLNSLIMLNTASVISFGTVVMTYFGVNYYLSGMHSYGSGTPPPIPVVVYIILAGIFLLVMLAVNSDKRLKK